MLYFKVKGSYLFDNDIGYISVNSSDNANIYKYRKIVSEQTDVDIENVVLIDKEEFEKNENN